MKKTILLALTTMAVGFGALAYDYTDDIYYNPKKDNSKAVSTKKSSKSSIVDFSTMDVDDYNKRGYYFSPIDTIGSYMENEPDFVYTTQIQKYYNPTIVTDNAAVLEEILNNSYGNIEIVYNYNGTPYFSPWYGYNWPYYGWASSYYYPWSWGVNFGPISIGWNNWWAWGPSWNWGPSWGWGPSWSWGWGPSWNWGWGGPGWHPGPNRPGWGAPPPRPMASYSPGGRAPFGAKPGVPGGGVGNFNGAPSQPGRTGLARRTQTTPSAQPSTGTNTNVSTPARPVIGTSGRRDNVQNVPNATQQKANSSDRNKTVTPSSTNRTTTTTNKTTTTTKRTTSTSRPAPTARPSAGSGSSRGSFGGAGRSNSGGGRSSGGRR